MKLSIYCLDDNPDLIRNEFKPFEEQGLLDKGSVLPKEFCPGGTYSLRVKGLDENPTEISIMLNSSLDPEEVIDEVKQNENSYDLVLIDDDWGLGGGAAGQQEILPVAVETISGFEENLPAFALFTQHWHQPDRATSFCKKMQKLNASKNLITGLKKNDFSSLLILIQSVALIKKLARQRDRLVRQEKVLKDNIGDINIPNGFIGKSLAMYRIYERIEKISKAVSPVLINGESGTGKDLAAKEIHNQSDRGEGPFRIYECPKADGDGSRVLSDLFGHKKGAFTDAKENFVGAFEEANGGTLFFDEIADFPYKHQAKLLRAVENGSIRPLGGKQDVAIDVRLICATQYDLKKKVEAGSFRNDLYQRLNIVKILMPPLNSRTGDVVLLANHFLKEVFGGHNYSFSDDALELLDFYDWTDGNVRALCGAIERGVIFCENKLVTAKDLELFIDPVATKDENDWNTPSALTGMTGYQYVLDKVNLLMAFVEETDNKKPTARDLAKYLCDKDEDKDNDFNAYERHWQSDKTGPTWAAFIELNREKMGRLADIMCGLKSFKKFLKEQEPG